MMGFFQRFQDQLDPVRSIGKVNPAEGLLSSPQAAPQTANRESLLDYMNQWGAYTPMDWQSIAPQLAHLGIDPKGQDGARGWQYNGGNPQHDSGGDIQPWSLTPEAQSKLQGYTLGDASQLDRNAWQRQIYDPSGQGIGQSNEDRSKSMAWIEAAVPMALSAMGANALGPVFGGGTVGGALSGATSSGLVAGATGGDVGKAILMGGLGGGFNGYMQGGGGLDPFTPDALKAWGQGAGVGLPDWESAIAGLGQSGIDVALEQAAGGFTSDALQSWGQSAGRGVPDWESQIAATSSGIPPTTPAGGVPTTGLSDFRADELRGYETDGRLPSPAAPDTLPTTGVNDFRAGEIKDYATDGRLPTSPAVPTGAGGLLGTLKGAGGTALDWMKANPGLTKALLGGAGALLSTQGGGSSGGAPKQYGPAVQWKSPVAGIPQGLLGGGQGGQMGGQGGYPAAMGLLGGQQNSGAWRFLR